MRWKSLIYPHSDGENRIVTRFLFFPVSLAVGTGGKYETRWIEFARIRQTYIWNDGLASFWNNDYWAN